MPGDSRQGDESHVAGGLLVGRAQQVLQDVIFCYDFDISIAVMLLNHKISQTRYLFFSFRALLK